MKAQCKPIYTKQKYVWFPIPHPSGTELSLVLTSQEDDVVNSRDNKKKKKPTFLYLYLPEKKPNSKGKLNRFSEIFPFVPDYMINLAPALKPIITCCLLNFTSAVSLLLLNSITGFYSKTSFSKEKQLQMVTYHLHGNKGKERLRGRNPKLAFDEMHYSTPHVRLMHEV